MNLLNVNSIYWCELETENKKGAIDILINHNDHRHK